MRAKDKSRLTGKRLWPEYGVWKSMRTRCTNPNTASWDRYGGRGISVCERWNSFDAFIEDMGRRPTPEHTLDRVNNDGNYEPGNCRWATIEEQRSNTRRNRHITAHGKTQTIMSWEKELHVSHQTILRRLKLGATPEQALMKDIRVLESTFHIDPVRLKNIRERCGLSQREACERSGIAPNQWNIMESSSRTMRATLEIIESIASAL